MTGAIQDAPTTNGGSVEGVPKWLSDLVFDGAEGVDEYFDPGMHQRMVEGGVETHITKLTSDVPSISSIGCIQIDVSAKAETQSGHGTNVISDPHAPLIEVGVMCNILHRAFDRAKGALQSIHLNGGERSRIIEHEVARNQPLHVPGSLADGFCGAGGELDAFDVSMLPPVFTKGSGNVSGSCYALTSNVPKSHDHACDMFQEAKCNFVSLPVYADDVARHWGIEAIMQQKSLPNASPSTGECTTSADANLHGVHPKLQSISQPYVDVDFGYWSMKWKKYLSEVSVESKNTSKGRSGPLEWLTRSLVAWFASRKSCKLPDITATSGVGGGSRLDAASKASSVVQDTCSIEGLSDCVSVNTEFIPTVMVNAFRNVLQFALDVQASGLLPLLPGLPCTSVSSLFAHLAKEEVQQLFYLESRKDSSNQKLDEHIVSGEHGGNSAAKGFTWMSSLAVSVVMCSMWMLVEITDRGADGVQVGDLLQTISGTRVRGTEKDMDSCAAFSSAACMTFLNAADRVASGVANQESSGVGSGAVESMVSCTACKLDKNGSTCSFSHRSSGSYDDLWSASACHIFLVCVSMLCKLRIVCQIPGGKSWRLVCAEAAATRFCLPRQRILVDLMVERPCDHIRNNSQGTKNGNNKGSEIQESFSHEPRVFSTCSNEAFACSRYTSDTSCIKDSKDFSFRPCSIPRAAWVYWGSAATETITPNEQNGGSQVAYFGHDTTHLRVASIFAWLIPSTKESAIAEGGATSPLVEECVSAQERDSGTAGLGSGVYGTEESWNGRRSLKVSVLSKELNIVSMWTRLDGRLNLSLLQLLCLRLWALAVQRPGSTLDHFKAALCVVDDCEVQFLLNALTEEGILMAYNLPKATQIEDGICAEPLPPSKRCGVSDPKEVCGISVARGILKMPCAIIWHSVIFVSVQVPRKIFREALKADAVEYALRRPILYFPCAAADVLPKFDDVLRPCIFKGLHIN